MIVYFAVLGVVFLELWMYTAEELSQLIKEKRIDQKKVIETYLKRIKMYDDTIRSFVQIKEDYKIQDGDFSENSFPVPFSLKDNIMALGFRTTCASKALWNYQATYDSTVNGKLKNADAILIGKNNMDEFAMGSSTENSAFFPTKNPWDFQRIPGGSSGGSAAAVAAGLIPFSLGSDTGGSVRLPASFCGVVGFKPTYGLVSRYGLVAFSSSMDQIGPICRSVRDAALITEKICGFDGYDSTCVKKRTSLISGIERNTKPLKCAVIKEYLDNTDHDIKSLFDDNLKLLKWAGIEFDTVSFEKHDSVLPVYHIISNSEASSNLARYDGVKYGLRIEENSIERMNMSSRNKGFGEEVKKRIISGVFSTSMTNYREYYLNAEKMRQKINIQLNEILKEYDVIISPTSPQKQYKMGETTDPMKYYLLDNHTVIANLCGFPAISIPMGFTGDLPQGLQIIGRKFEDSLVLNVARTVEKKIGVFEDGIYPFPHLEASVK